MLKDLKILDFTTLLPGPYATWMLQSMGAEVLKISAPGRTDMVLAGGPEVAEGVTANRNWLMSGKTEIFLDLKSDEGRKKVKQLISEEGYNCIIEQFRPGVMAGFGLSYEELKDEFPELVYVSITGYGQQGSYKDKAGHDINYLALSGIMDYSGRVEEGPSLYGMQIGDIMSSQNAVIGCLAAHNKRKLKGEGCHVDVSIAAGLMPCNAMSGAGALATGENPRREGDWLNGGSCYDFYQTKDKKYISVGALEPKFWARFCRVMQHQDWIEAGCVTPDFQRKKEILREEFLSQNQDYWIEKFKDEDACVEPVLSVTEAADFHEDLFEMRNGVRTYKNPIKFSTK